MGLLSLPPELARYGIGYSPLNTRRIPTWVRHIRGGQGTVGT